MNAKLPKSVFFLGSVPLAILGWMLILGLGSTHIYAEEDQSSSDKQSIGLSLDLFSRESDGTLNLTPSVSVSTPILDVEVPSIRANDSTGQLDVSELKVDTPLGSAQTSEISVNVNQGKVELPSVQVDTPVLKSGVSSGEVDLNDGKASLLGVTAEVPEVIKAETSAVKTDLRQGKASLPSVRVDVPEVTSVDVSSTRLDLTQGEIDLPLIKAEVPVVDISAEINPGKAVAGGPTLKPEEPSVTPEQPVSTEGTPVATKPNKERLASTDQVSSQDNAVGQSLVEIPGQVIEAGSQSKEPQEQPVVQQAMPIEKSNVQPNSDVKVVLTEDEPILVDQPSSIASVTDQLQDSNNLNVITQKSASDKLSPIQPSTERPTGWSVMEKSTFPGAMNASTSGSSGSSGITGGGATAPAAALPGAINGLAGPNSGFAFQMEPADGFSQWSQAPPGQPPQYTSFSQTQGR